MVSLSFILVNFYLAVIKNKEFELFSMYVLFTIFIQVGYALKIGNFTIAMNDILLLYLFVYTLLKILKTKSINKLNIYIAFIAIIVLIGYINIYICTKTSIELLPIFGDFDKQFIYGDELKQINFSKDNILRMIIFFMFLVVIINNNFLKYKIELQKRIIVIAKFQIAYVLLEYVLKIIGIYPVIIDKILLILGSHGDYQVRRIIIREGNLWLQGLTLEPGYLGFSFFIILLTLDNYNDKTSKILEIVIFFFSILNRSLTSFVLLGVYLIIKILNKKFNFKVMIMIIMIGMIVLNFINHDFSKYIIRIQNIINGDNSIRSENIRRSNIVNAIKLISKYPIFGYGLGNTKALSGILSFILNIGFLGTFLWYKLLNKIYTNQKLVNKILIVGIFIILGGLENLYNIYIPLIMLLLSKEMEERE